jgi:hypothetical protein
MLEITAESSSSYDQIPIKLVLRAMRGRSRLVKCPFLFHRIKRLDGPSMSSCGNDSTFPGAVIDDGI